MNSDDPYLEVLQNIEFAVVQVWKKNSTMTNYAVMRAYDAAISFYGALARQHAPKPISLTGIDALLFEEIQKVCEWRLGRTAGPTGEAAPVVSTEVLVSCLRKVRKSVDHWTEQGGRQGYMQFIERFVG